MSDRQRHGSIDAITLDPLRRDQYRQACEWEYGPQPENIDWAKYERDIEDPAWAHFALSLEGQFVGCIRLERLAGDRYAFHVATARKAVHPETMAAILCRIADHLFANGVAEVQATAPLGMRAVAKLAIRCGMTFRDESEEGRRFTITKEERAQHVADQSRARAA